MARVSKLRGAAILDTSWLLELYRVPGHFDESRTLPVKTETAEFINSGYELFVTVPVLFEVASHINHVSDGRIRRSLSEKLLGDITKSTDRDTPWTIITVERGILFRSDDIIRLAQRFFESSGPNYSFADISVIDLANELRHPGRAVKILAFDDQIVSYSD